MGRIQKEAGVYVMYEGEIPVYVGRTRWLKRRISGHRSGTRFSSTFALRRAKAEWIAVSTENTNSKTSDLFEFDDFKSIFRTHTDYVKSLAVKFLPCDDTLTQYILEAYAICALELDVKELQTH